MSDSKGEGGSWLYGIILILSGGFIAAVGFLNVLNLSELAYYVEQIMPILGTHFDTFGYLEIAIGGWGVIGGIGLIKDQEWGWGISLVVLSLVIVTFLADVIAGVIAGTWYSFMFWIELVALIVAGVGIAYLLITKEKYA